MRRVFGRSLESEKEVHFVVHEHKQLKSGAVVDHSSTSRERLESRVIDYVILGYCNLNKYDA